MRHDGRRRRDDGPFGNRRRGDRRLDEGRSGTRHGHRGTRRGHAQQFAGDDAAGGQHQGRQRRDQHDRQFLRIGRRVRHDGARDDAAIGRRRLNILPRRRLAIFGEIGFQEVALRLGLALQRAGLHVLAVGRGRLLLDLFEAVGQAIDTAGGDPGIVLQRARKFRCLLAQLAVEVAELRFQFLDARMAVEQRRGLFGELRAQRHALLRQPPDQLGVQHFRGFDRPPALQHVLDHSRSGFSVGFKRAGIVELGVDLTELLVRQRRVVGADEQARLRTEFLGAGFRVRHLLAQIVDLAGQPLPRGLGLFLARALLHRQIAVRDRVGDPCRQLRIARLEFDHHHARLVDRIGRQPFVIGVEHALLGRHRERIASDAEQRQQRLDRRHAVQHRIEFRPLGELVLLDDVTRQIARQQQLHLAGDGFGVERGALLVALAIRSQKDVFAPVDQDARFGLVARRNQVDGDQRQQQRQCGRDQHPGALAVQGMAECAQIEIAKLWRRHGRDRSRHRPSLRLAKHRRAEQGPAGRAGLCNRRGDRIARPLVLAFTPECQTHRTLLPTPTASHTGTIKCD